MQVKLMKKIKFSAKIFQKEKPKKKDKKKSKKKKRKVKINSKKNRKNWMRIKNTLFLMVKSQFEK